MDDDGNHSKALFAPKLVNKRPTVGWMEEGILEFQFLVGNQVFCLELICRQNVLRESPMKTPIALLLAATVFSAPVFAQTKAPADAKPAPAAVSKPAGEAATTMANDNTATPTTASAQWRASKLVGVNVYNQEDKSIGEINEALLDNRGKVVGFVVGVGGFLGMGEHEVLIPFDQLKFVNEPMRTATAAPTTAPHPVAPGATTAMRPATTGAATTNAAVRDNQKKWYPDHAVINATKEQLKSMQQFKYN